MVPKKSTWSIFLKTRFCLSYEMLKAWSKAAWDCILNLLITSHIIQPSRNFTTADSIIKLLQALANVSLLHLASASPLHLSDGKTLVICQDIIMTWATSLLGCLASPPLSLTHPIISLKKGKPVYTSPRCPGLSNVMLIAFQVFFLPMLAYVK